MLIVLDDAQYDEFLSIVEQPPRELPKLQALLQQKSPFIDEIGCE